VNDSLSSDTTTCTGNYIKQSFITGYRYKKLLEPNIR